MKSTGISRPVDSLGRIVIPMELRESLGIKTKDTLDIFVDGNNIVLRKSGESCVFCDERDDVIAFEGKKICRNCLYKLSDYN